MRLDDTGIQVGQRIGDYEVVGKLGAGGLGVVYEARHVISQRAEAMKVLLPSQTGTPEMVERFRRIEPERTSILQLAMRFVAIRRNRRLLLRNDRAAGCQARSSKMTYPGKSRAI